MSLIHGSTDGSIGECQGNPLPILQQLNEVLDDNHVNSKVNVKPRIQTDLDDIQEEVEYWNSAIV